MRPFLIHIRRYDWLLMGAVLLLILFGMLSLFSLSGVSVLPFFHRQLLWAAIGLFFLIAASFIDFRIFRMQSAAVILFYIFSIILLVFVLAVSARVRGVEAWIRFGVFSFQPVELAKLALVILLAKFFSKRHIEIYRIEHLLVSGFYVGVPIVLVLVQPDLGSAVILAAIWLAVVAFSGMKLRHFAALALIGLIVVTAGWGWALAPYQKTRVISFLDPYADPKGAGYQMIQSMIAVGSGKIWGKGIGYGSQSHLNFLPEAETDFIFAAFAEEWGLVGVAAFFAVLAVLLWRILHISMRASDNFSRLYALGFAALIFSQSFVHIGMNMGILPITGITLPFVSYGGSSLITLLVGVGILQNIKVNSRSAQGGESFI